MKLQIVGCYSATPRKSTQTTAQVLYIKGEIFLIDCGEGTQMKLRELGVSFSKIKHIFISHLHGDHCFGLIGLISTFRLLGREKELHIYGPKGIEEMITLQLKLANSWTNYSLVFHELSSKKSELIFENKNIKVSTVPLKHRVYTNGFLFEEKEGLRKINKEAIKNYSIEKCDFLNLQNGKDIELSNGEILANDKVTFSPEPPKKYAFCSDTIYNEEIVPIIKNANLLYHESTFLNEHLELAKKTFHSTAGQAGKIAKLANVKQLLLGHYSTRYKHNENFKIEAKKEFENTILSEDGLKINIE